MIDIYPQIAKYVKKNNLINLIKSMLEHIYKFISFFNDKYWYDLILLMGLSYKPYRRIFFWGLIGACLCILFNSSLKAIFKVPLFPHLGHGYALPSGHLSLASFIYLWLAKFRVCYIQKIVFGLIPLFAFVTVKLNYHTALDVLCGIISGTSFYLFYDYLYNQAIHIRVKVIVCLWAIFFCYLYTSLLFGQKIIIISFILLLCLLILPYVKFKHAQEI